MNFVVAVFALQIKASVKMGLAMNGVLANAEVGGQRKIGNWHFVGQCKQNIAQRPIGGQLVGHFSAQQRVGA